MAGGDGSQALVAAIAAEHDLPYACIPSGTRNHFALDLGVDREDVVGALDAFVDGGERYVDLGEVNGRVFVNNVSLGVYAEAVSQEQLPRVEAADAARHAGRHARARGRAARAALDRPRGHRQRSTALILVSNNPYLLGPTLGLGHPAAPGRAACSESSTSTRRSRGRGAQAARWRELAAAELEIERRRPGPGRHRRRGGDPGAAAALQGPPSALQGPDRPQPPRRIALGRRPAGGP